MLGILAIICFAIFLIFFLPIISKRIYRAPAPKSQKYNMQMKKLWTIAQSSMKDSKPLRAEKALLTILKFDEKNAAAYNRLGILYAKDNKFDEAIECFEIAQSLDNNPSSLHNVGLIYLETGAYEKAEMAFLQALDMEGDMPARFIALAKAREKLGKRKEAIEALESAFDLDGSTTTLRQILAIYESVGDEEKITETTARIAAQVAAKNKKVATKKKVVRHSSARPRSMDMAPRKPVVRKTISRPANGAPGLKSAPRPTNRTSVRRKKIM